MFTAKSLPTVVSSAGRSNAISGPLAGDTPRSMIQESGRSLPPPALPVRPKVSLLTGSVLVLLTLFLPVGYSQCSNVRFTGRDYLLGLGAWPGSLDAVSYAGGRVPYFLTVVLAALTVFLVIAAQIRPASLQKTNRTHHLFVLAGTLFLFTIGDFFWFQLASRIGDFFEARLTQSSLNVLMVMIAASTIAVSAVCLRSRLLRGQRWIVRLFAIAVGISLFGMIHYLLVLFGVSPIIPPDWAFFVTISPSVLYFVVPLGLWYHFGLSQREELRTQWLGIRRRIILLYLPAAIFDLFVLAFEMRPGSLWGLLPYFAGVTLISWGYLGLERQATLSSENARADGSEQGLAEHAGVHAV